MESLSVAEVAAACGGRVVGDGDRRLAGVRALEGAGADALSFVKGVTSGQNIQTAALSVLGKRAVQMARGQAAIFNPPRGLVRRGRQNELATFH